MIRAQVDEKKETEIKEKTAAVDKEIEREEEKVKELENKFIEAKNGCDRAEKGFKKVKEDYDSARELQKEIDHKLSELNHTRKSIEEEEKKKNFANVYFLIDGEERESGLGSLMKELAELTEKSKRLSPALGEKFEMKAALEEFKTTLAKRWKAFYEAERDLSVKEKEMEQAKDAFAEGQERWDQLRKSRRSNILEKLKEIKFSK
jgi:chromosome segregation ATPase